MFLLHQEPPFIGLRSLVQLWSSMECDKLKESVTKDLLILSYHAHQVLHLVEATPSYMYNCYTVHVGTAVYNYS